MKTTLAFLCDAANMGPDRKLNVLGIFTTISARRFPATHPSFCLVLKVQTDSSEAGNTNLTARLLSPDGDDLLPQLLIPIKIGSEGGEVISVTTISMLTLPEPGDYSFEISAMDSFLASVPLRVIKEEKKAAARS